jgi:large subunit ribosomal protein L17
MRHRKAHRKLGRVADHRIAMFRNQAHALLKYEHIETTVPRAKELRPFVERLITIAKRGNAGGGNGGALHARRLVLRDLPDQAVVGKLFDTIAPRFAARPGGYTRIIRLGYRRGDSAEVAQLELVGSEFDPKAAPKDTKSADAPKAKGVGDRIRAAAERLRGKKEDDAESKKARGASTKGRAAKKNTPQKSG